MTDKMDSVRIANMSLNDSVTDANATSGPSNPPTEGDVQFHLNKLREICGTNYVNVMQSETERQTNATRPQLTSAPSHHAPQIRYIHTPKRPTAMQIPVFEGKQPGKPGYISVEVFLRAVEQETKIGDFSDAERILLAREYVRGAARNKFDNHRLLDFTDWRRFQDEMLYVYGHSPDEMLTHLHLLTPYRKVGELLCEYIDRISIDLNNYSPTGEMPDHEKVHHLRRILKITLPQELKTPLLISRTYSELVRNVLAYAEGQTQARLTEADIMKEKEIGLQSTVAATATKREREREEESSATSTPAVAAISGRSQTDRYAEGQGNNNYGRHQPPRGRGTHGTPYRGRSYYAPGRGRGAARGGGRGNVINPCAGCGGNHLRNTCTKSHNVMCYHCGIWGHFSYVCRKNVPWATDSFPVATSTTSMGAPSAPQFNHRAPQFDYRAPQFDYRGPQFDYRGPQFMRRYPSPPQMPAVGAVATHPPQPETFPWLRQAEMLASQEEQQQQQQQQQLQQQHYLGPNTRV